MSLHDLGDCTERLAFVRTKSGVRILAYITPCKILDTKEGMNLMNCLNHSVNRHHSMRKLRNKNKGELYAKGYRY